MASVEDRWFRQVRDESGEPQVDERGKPVLEKTDRHGVGLRWLVRWREPDGRERKLSFAKKTLAEAHAASVETDKLRGTYIDVRAGRELFGVYAARWLAQQTTDPLTRQNIRDRLRRYVEPYALHRAELRGLKPSSIQAWLRALATVRTSTDNPLAESTVRVVFSHVSAILNAAVEDELISRNPCRSASVRVPRADTREIEPWPREWVAGMADQLPEQYQVLIAEGAGLGLRQGEAFALATDDIDWLRGWVTVQRQVKLVGNKLVFALPKGRKVRRVPLPPSVRDELAAHLARHSVRAVTLPWEQPGGKPTTAPLIATTRESGALNRNHFNQYVWKPAQGRVGMPSERVNGMHALRHFYASVLLDAGENIKALSAYLGHSSAAFTLKYYAHLMPTSETRTRSAVDAILVRPESAPAATADGLTSDDAQNRRNSSDSMPRRVS
jgi:integrase